MLGRVPAYATKGNNLANAQPYDLVTLTASVPFDRVTFVTGKWLGGKDISAETTMRHE